LFKNKKVLSSVLNKSKELMSLSLFGSLFLLLDNLSAAANQALHNRAGVRGCNNYQLDNRKSRAHTIIDAREKIKRTINKR